MFYVLKNFTLTPVLTHFFQNSVRLVIVIQLKYNKNVIILNGSLIEKLNQIFLDFLKYQILL